jgi:hypothetical protein
MMGLRSNLRAYPMFHLFLACYTVVHLHFEHNFWVVGEAAIFSKYGSGDLLDVGQKVYYAKATWCFLMIWLLALQMHYRAAVAWSFLVYALQLVVLFPLRIYAGLNVLLAIGMVIEVLLEPAGRPKSSL